MGGMGGGHHEFEISDFKEEYKSKNRSFFFLCEWYVFRRMNAPVKMKTSSGYSSDKECWNAVVQRDPKADGRFYYSVKTTGVYCRPSCASRRPLRANVDFHESCEAAEAAGFRPCKRCQPRGNTLTEQYSAKVAAACRRIEEAPDAPNLDALAKGAAMSKFHFHRVFTRLTGLTPKAYAKAHRAQRMRRELPRRDTVTEAIYGAGFNSNGRFYAESSRMLGMAPKKFNQGGRGETIRFAVGVCSLGAILVAASHKGVCAISLGDDPDKLVKDLQDVFPKANLIGGDKSFERVVSVVVGFVEAPGIGLDLPLDVRGTAFQQRVWKALREIPTGTTVSYAEIAGRIGLPKSVRAVARACASNKIAVAIPCHRVLRTDGDISGYRWGVKRKRVLLERERKLV
jgi:AraC family transcriptional regulator, regulatory protein of adaptative response / methylated-DNA-[protein]-cysteine methyltransferase